MKITPLIAAMFLAMAAQAQAASPFGIAGYAQVRSSLSPDQARNARQQSQVLPVSQVIAIAQARHPGTQVLDVVLSDGAQPRYRVILKTRDGRRIDVVIDAKTGRVLSERGA